MKQVTTHGSMTLAGGVVKLAVPALLLVMVLTATAEEVRGTGKRKTGAAERDMAEGFRHFEAGGFREAAKVFEEVVRGSPTSTEALLTLGITYYRINRFLEAVETFEQVITLKPEFAPAHARQGFAYSQLNLPREAIGAFKKAVSYQPDLAHAHWGLGLAYRQLGFYDEAAESFREVIRLRPDFAEAHYGLAEVCLIMKERCTPLEEYTILKKLDKELAAKLFDLIYR